jgi:thiamine pyrophosphokinase
MSQSTFTILLGGELHLTDRLRAAVTGSRFIAADGGMRHAATLGVLPELWVGDFDSTPPDLDGAFPNVPKQPYPAAKAATDGEIAIQEAIERGARRLILAGALGAASNSTFRKTACFPFPASAICTGFPSRTPVIRLPISICPSARHAPFPMSRRARCVFR